MTGSSNSRTRSRVFAARSLVSQLSLLLMGDFHHRRALYRLCLSMAEQIHRDLVYHLVKQLTATRRTRPPI